MNQDVSVDPAELFEHVYARPTAALERQRAALLARTGGGRAMTTRMSRRPSRRGPRAGCARRPPVTMAAALNQALADSLAADERVRRLRRGRRHARRGLPRHRRARRPVRRAPRLRHAAGRVRHRRHRHRHGDERPGPGRRDAVRRLRLPRLRAGHQPPRQAAQPDPGARRAARGHPGPVRRRHRRRRAPQRLLRGLLHAHPGTARGDARHPGGRLPPAAPGDQLPRPGHLPRAQAPLLVQGDSRR